jgi:hypothetical protein
MPSAMKSMPSRTDFRSKKLKEKTAGPKWFDLPAPAEADLPRLHKEYEALRLRNQLDPKRFYRKDPGEGRGIKGLPKHFAVRSHPGSAIYFTLYTRFTDWHDRSNEHTVWWAEWGQFTTFSSQTYACGGISRRCGGTPLFQAQV